MGLEFHEENIVEQSSKKDSYLTKLLLKKGLVKDLDTAKKASAFILIGIIVFACIVIFMQNSDPEIEAEYYFDPEIDNAYNDAL